MDLLIICFLDFQYSFFAAQDPQYGKSDSQRLQRPRRELLRHDPRRAADADNYSPDRAIKRAKQKECQPALQDNETKDSQVSLETQLDAQEKAAAESAAAATAASSRTGLARCPSWSSRKK